MPHFRSAASAVFLLLVAVCGIAPPGASAQTTASDYVQTLGNRAILELTDKSVSDRERVKRMRQLLTESFDVPAVGQFVLGTYWRQASEEERDEFMKLYSIVVAHTYAGLFKKYSGEQFKVLRERAVDDDNIVVYSQILQPGTGEPVNVEITTKKEPAGEYKAVDIKVEGISMPLTHRKEYASVIQRNRGQVSALLKVLKQKAESLEAENPSQ
jgi:phospholipid transport system substrate-binding protein